MERRHRCCFVAALMAIVSTAVAEPPAAQIVVYVDWDAGPVNRRILGNNALAYLDADPVYSMRGSGMWDPAGRRSVPAMAELARNVGISTLRWPGGCGVHYYNWKRTVGPIEERPKQAFGLPEFIAFCKDIRGDPIITLSAFWGGPDDAADIVEYLNAPSGQNPSGGKDWAKVRVADGHAEPIGVVWFEYGNETNHGGHRRYGSPIEDKLSPAEYCGRYRAYRKAMRAVDPRIKLGAVLANDVVPDLCPWTREVIDGLADMADFYIHHPYLPAYHFNHGKPPADDLYRIALASARQFDAVYEAIGERVYQATGGRPIPLAITEYNGHFVQNKPVPYRLSLGTAVQMADLLLVLLDPRHHVENAQYWQFANEYWGMVKGHAGPYTLRPAYHALRLFHEHLGDRLLAVRVRCGSYDTSGGFSVLPAAGQPGDRTPLGLPEPIEPDWRLRETPGARASVSTDGVLAVEITTDGELNYYYSRIRMPAEAIRGYRVTAEIRTDGLENRGAQIQVGDDRGWDATRSVALSDAVISGEWTPVAADYVTLADSKGIDVLARRLGPASDAGRFWIRNLRVQEYRPRCLGSVPYLAALATRKENAVSIFIVNRRIDGPSPCRIRIAGAREVRAWTLSGPTVDATNETDPDNVKTQPLATRIVDDTAHVTLAPHSLTVVRAAVSGRDH